MRLSLVIGSALLAALAVQAEAHARGYGAARGGVAVGPRGGVAAGGARGGVVSGPYGGVSAGGARGGTYVGPRGTTVQHAGVGGVTRGPLGGVRAGGAEATRVTTPGGRTYTSAERGGVAVGPAGGVRAGGASAAAVSGPFGGAAAVHRGGAAVGPYGGVAVGGTRAVGLGHVTSYYSPGAMRTTAGYVRTGWGGVGYSCFTPTWYRGHAAAWVAPRWRVNNFWVAPAWPAVSVYCGISAAPILYDYGSTVVIENNYVYVNGDQVGTAEQYAD